MKEQRFTVPLGVGISSLVSIFVTLTLVILSVLGLQSVYSYRQSINQQTAYVKAYYRADNKGEWLIKEMHQLILKTAFHDLVEAIDTHQDLKHYESLNREGDGSLKITYKIPVNDNQNLHITVELNKEISKKEQMDYQIMEWEVVTDLGKMGWEIGKE